MPIDRFGDDTLYAALLRRDPAFDGRAFVGVTSTAVLCRLTCPARKPKRENTVFFATAAAGLVAGFRPCKRCRPLAAAGETPPLVASLLARVAETERWTERDLAAAGFDPSTVRRAFRRHLGTTFLGAARRLRVERGRNCIAAGSSVITAQLEAGFGSSSGFRSAVKRAFGRPPAQIRQTSYGEPAIQEKASDMANQIDKARRFAALHVKGEPLILFNIWDAGSARAVAGAGASAVATGSWSVAAAQGYPDGEALPFDLLEVIVGRIAAAVDLPVSVDLESGYAVEPSGVAANVGLILAAGAVGVNLEDGVVGAATPAVYAVEAQVARIRAARAAADSAGVPLFLNARTDLFLRAPPAEHGASLADALSRAAAYAAAGADGFFAPGLADDALIARLCAATPLPVNVMLRGGMSTPARLARLGVARISHGPAPHRAAMAALGLDAAAALRSPG